jgi:hypothetical protein
VIDFKSEGRLKPSNSRLMLGSFVAAAILVFLLCFLFDPRWETNDDVGMSMVAHGYGIAAIGSPNLIFSNVLWGYLVRLIPEVSGVLGYSFATLSVLVFVGTTLIYGLRRLDLGYAASIFVLVLILARPVLFPQFTINAGLLMVGAIICWHLFARQHDKGALVAGCLLAFCSYLVRSKEALLVLGVALPLLPWRTMLLHRAPKIAIFVLVSAIAASAVIDQQAYQGDEWRSFNELNPVRAPFTDFGVGAYLKQRPLILEHHRYSPNDIDLVGSWFFVDASITNPGKLRAVLGELGLFPLLTVDAFVSAASGVRTLWHPTLLPFVLAAFLLTVLRPSWRTVAVWGLCVAAVFVLGLLGRPGVLRIYVPLVCLLVIAPFLAQRSEIRDQGSWRNWLTMSVILVATLINTSTVILASKASSAASGRVRQGLTDFPTYPVVVWGASFPFEASYPVLHTSRASMSYRLYGLGVFTLAPFSVAFAEQKVGRGMTDVLAGESGLPIIATEQHLGKLVIYCRERLHGDLKELSTKLYGQIRVSRHRCKVAL